LVVASVDKNLTVFLKKYFPKETKAKQQENDIAASVEMYGEDFANVKCLVM
jgi:E3 ubiquitin-protein ligase BAH